MNSISDIFVKKLSERMGKILTREEIEILWMRSGGSKSRISYGITQMKGRGMLVPLGGGLYTTGVVDNHGQYWQMIDLLIRRYAPSGALIAHEKSMEYYLYNYEIPDTLVLYTRDISKRIIIGENKIEFRTLKSGGKSGMKNMYRMLSDLSHLGEIDTVKFRLLSLESCLLDVASLRIHDSGIAEDLILRFLKKYAKKISRDILGRLVGYRYIRAINRIRTLSKTHGYTEIYEMCLDIIKKEGGGCYLAL